MASYAADIANATAKKYERRADRIMQAAQKNSDGHCVDFDYNSKFHSYLKVNSNTDSDGTDSESDFNSESVNARHTAVFITQNEEQQKADMNDDEFFGELAVKFDIERVEEAMAGYSRALTLRGNTQCYLKRATTYLILGDLSSASFDIHRAITATVQRNKEFAVSTSKVCKTKMDISYLLASLYYAIGTAHLRVGRLENAVSCFTEALKYHSSQRFFMARILAYTHYRQYDTALEDLNTFISRQGHQNSDCVQSMFATTPSKITPLYSLPVSSSDQLCKYSDINSNAQPYLLRAKINMLLNRPVAAFKDYQTLAALSADSIEVRQLLLSLRDFARSMHIQALALMLKNEHASAIKIIDDALIIEPANDSMQLLRAKILHQLGSDIDALQQLNIVSTIFETQRKLGTRSDISEVNKLRSDVYFSIANSLMKEAKYVDAILALSEALRLSRKASFYMCRGDCYRLHGNIELALHDYQQSISPTTEYEAKKRLALIHHEIGRNLFNTSNYVMAEHHLSKAIEFTKGVQFFIDRARVRKKLLNYDLALSDIEEALKLQPNNQKLVNEHSELSQLFRLRTSRSISTHGKTRLQPIRIRLDLRR